MMLWSKGVWRMIARCSLRRAAPCLKTSLLLVACTDSDSDLKNLQTPIQFLHAGQMSHESLIRQACSLSVNSSSQLLTHVILAISESGKEYRKAMSELMQLLDDSLIVISNTGSPLQDEINDHIVERRNQIDDQRKAIMDLVSLMDYVEKNVTSTAETAFLAGAELSSTLICERLNSALQKVVQECAANKQVEDELLQLYESYIYKLAELADSKSTVKEKNDIKISVQEDTSSETYVPAETVENSEEFFINIQSSDENYVA